MTNRKLRSSAEALGYVRISSSGARSGRIHRWVTAWHQSVLNALDFFEDLDARGAREASPTHRVLKVRVVPELLGRIQCLEARHDRDVVGVVDIAVDAVELRLALGRWVLVEHRRRGWQDNLKNVAVRRSFEVTPNAALGPSSSGALHIRGLGRNTFRMIEWQPTRRLRIEG